MIILFSEWRMYTMVVYMLRSVLGHWLEEERFCLHVCIEGEEHVLDIFTVEIDSG